MMAHILAPGISAPLFQRLAKQSAGFIIGGHVTLASMARNFYDLTVPASAIQMTSLTLRLLETVVGGAHRPPGRNHVIN